jgi:hypothetical protein
MFDMYVFNGKYKNGPFFYSRILNQTVAMPKEFSSELADLVTRFLEKDPRKRLGTGEGGAAAIKSHPFFHVRSSPIYVIIQ